MCRRRSRYGCYRYATVGEDVTDTLKILKYEPIVSGSVDKGLTRGLSLAMYIKQTRQEFRAFQNSWTSLEAKDVMSR